MKTKNILAVLLIGSALGVGGFFIYKKSVIKKNPFEYMTDDQLAKYIFDSGNHGSKDTLIEFERDYLVKWAKAIKAGETTFTYGPKEYNTKGGKAV